MYQVFMFRNVWKQLVERLVVLHETLKKMKDMLILHKCTGLV